MKQTNLNYEKDNNNFDSSRSRFNLFLTGLGAFFAAVLSTILLLGIVLFIFETNTATLAAISYYSFFSFLYLLVYSALTTKTENITLIKRLAHIAKRLLDVFLSSITLFFISPLVILLAIAIKIESPGPVFYRLQRIGQYGKLINIYKFRVTEYPPTEQSLTKTGKFLRRFSIEELPQMYNVLEGDLSIVGPWPRIPKHLEQTIDNDKKILSMKPGITGLWQISFSDIDLAKEYDLRYVQNWSLWLDIKIMLKTIFVVMTNEN